MLYDFGCLKHNVMEKSCRYRKAKEIPLQSNPGNIVDSSIS